MATRNIVPRATGEGGLGVTGKRWGTAYINETIGKLTGTAWYASTAGTSSFASSAANAGSAGSATTAANAGTASKASSAGNAGTALAIQAPLTNLLTNSQWMAMSGSGLTQGAASGRQTDFNVSNILADADGSSAASWTGTDCTITDAGANLRITQTGGGTQYAKYTCAGLTAGKLYKFAAVVANGTGAWGAGDKLRVEQNGGTLIKDLASEAAGTYSIIWKAVGATDKVTFTVTLGAGETLNLTSVYVDEVTPGYVAADTLAPDGWEKTDTLDILREHKGTYTKAGSFYALKVTKGANGSEYLINTGYTLEENIQKYAGRTVTMGAWVYASNASNAYLRINDGTAYHSTAHSGTPGWEWLELTVTFSATPSYCVFGFRFDSDTSHVAYVSQPMLVFGSSIGSGNYQPIPNEVIWLQSVALVLNSYVPVSGDTLLNLEVLSSGKLGKGIKSIGGYIKGTNTAASKYLILCPAAGGAGPYGAYIITQVAATPIAGKLMGRMDRNGDIYLTAQDGNFSSVDVSIDCIQT